MFIGGPEEVWCAGAHAAEGAPPEASWAAAAAARPGTPQSASPAATRAWCTVTDRLRRLRADLEARSDFDTQTWSQRLCRLAQELC
jgi:hypothetical protein